MATYGYPFSRPAPSPTRGFLRAMRAIGQSILRSRPTPNIEAAAERLNRWYETSCGPIAGGEGGAPDLSPGPRGGMPAR